MNAIPPLLPLSPGDPAPTFCSRTASNGEYHFESVAGRYVVLCFYGSAGEPVGRTIIKGLAALRGEIFDDSFACLFGVSMDAADEHAGRVADQRPGVRFFWDFDGHVSALYGALRDGRHQPRTFVLDPMLRIVAQFVPTDPHQHVAEVTSFLRALPTPDETAGVPLTAPVLIIPRVFEPELCRHLIARYEADGGTDSGFMRKQGDYSVGVIDYRTKRRSDFTIEDKTLRQALRERIGRRVVNEIRRFFCFDATRLERYIVSCYDAGVGGYFRPHRDNNTPATVHRRFAVTINLNAEEYEGGNLRFPEFGTRTYRAPTGGAVVFACAMMHEATPVTRGRRFAFLPFLYDEAGARQRAATEELIRPLEAPVAVTPPPAGPQPFAQ